MLRSNLATRPFYNERLVRTGLVGLAALALGLTLFNAYEVVRLRGQSRTARETMASNDAQAVELRQKAQAIRRAIDKTKLDAIQVAAFEANALIDRRTFSWTELLNRFQTTLPADVRIAGVMPQRDENGRRLLQIAVYSKRIEDLEEFMQALEKTGAFSGVLPRSDQPDEAGTLLTQLQAYYRPTADAVPQASEVGPAGNATPAETTPGNVTPRGSR
jgi:hypothetical protein